MLGISFVLLNNVAGHLGILRNWTPWIVAAAPGLIYLLLSLAAFTWLVLRLADDDSAASSCSRTARAIRAGREPFEAVARARRARATRRCRCAAPSSSSMAARPARGRGRAGRRRRRAASASCRCSSAPAAMCARTCRGCSTSCAPLHPQVPLQLRAAVGEEPEVIDLLAGWRSRR